MAHFPRARKRFGQHFLSDPGVIQRIVSEVYPQEDDCIAEIGPGTGILTEPVLEIVDHLSVIELDKNLIPYLRAICPDEKRLQIYQTDVLKFDFAELINQCSAAKKLRLYGNLPYNISTPLLFHLFQYCSKIQDMHFMLQLEVAERICSKPGKKQYGRLSVMVQYHCQADMLFTIYPQAFTPPPKVDSAIICLRPHQTLPQQAKDYTLFTELVRTAFNHRRKTLHNALKPLFSGLNTDQIAIDLSKRAENLTVAEYVTLSNFISECKK